MTELTLKPKAIIFDCWNTLFYSNVNSSLQIFSRELLGRDLSYDFVKKFETAYMMRPYGNLEAATEIFLKSLGVDPTPEIKSRTWLKLEESLPLQQAYGDTFVALTELRRRGYKLGMITNSWQGAFEHLLSHQPLSDHLDVMTTSYECGLIKPDLRIFQLSLERLGVESHESLMVGDSVKDDVEAAQAAGLQAVLLDRNAKNLQYPNRIIDLAGLLQKV